MTTVQTEDIYKEFLKMAEHIPNFVFTQNDNFALNLVDIHVITTVGSTDVEGRVDSNAPKI